MRRHARPSQLTQKSGSKPDSVSLLRAYDIDSNPSRPLRSSPLTASTIQGLPLELIDRLRSFPLFASAPDTFLGAIGKYLRPQLHQPHDSILSEGQDARAMYWLVRGSVRVTSRDGESTYAELKPGAFFGEIGILMDMPRTASITASTRSLVVRLNKEDLQKELPNYPQVERAIREEAVERLAILERKKKEAGGITSSGTGLRKRSRDLVGLGDVEMCEAGDGSSLSEGDVLSVKKRKSPSPNFVETLAATALAKPHTTIRQMLTELPLFAGLPPEILHFLGVNAQPCTFAPFTDIIKQGSQGRDVYFIIQGEVEVVTETRPADTLMSGSDDFGYSKPVQRVRARFKTGHYFGEVTNLSLAPVRTATVRSINKVECLRITGDTVDKLWLQCPPDLRRQVETEAKRRLSGADMIHPVDGGADAQRLVPASKSQRTITPLVTFSEIGFDGKRKEGPVTEPLDPDPFFGAEFDARPKSRRSSLAPPLPAGGQSAIQEPASQPSTSRSHGGSPHKNRNGFLSAPTSPATSSPRLRPQLRRVPSHQGRGILPDSLLLLVLQHLNLLELMRMRQVSVHWHKLVTSNTDLLNTLDLSVINRKVTDWSLINTIAPFVGSRPFHVNLNNCFHVTDEGFAALVAASAMNVRSWRMRSVWDVSGQCILDLVNKAPFLEEIDLSNCRKVGDNLLARIVGWVIPQQSSNSTPAIGLGIKTGEQQQVTRPASMGSPNLKRLTLSYCKHVQDRSMVHIAQHAASRIEMLDLTRCTSVTDQGFNHWSTHSFPMLRKLVLADCTYLSDSAIVGIVNAARNLRELDLSFCCALSDTATEVISLGLHHLTHLDLAFCGSAVSDSSLRCIGLHLDKLRFLSVRGCVRVTGHGVESVIDGCSSLDLLDVSQCKNLTPWLNAGGVQMLEHRGCTTRFELVASGTWRAPM